jgi:hypothetical protein
MEIKPSVLYNNLDPLLCAKDFILSYIAYPLFLYRHILDSIRKQACNEYLPNHVAPHPILDSFKKQVSDE